jgi:hypothetical protein
MPQKLAAPAEIKYSSKPYQTKIAPSRAFSGL